MDFREIWDKWEYVIDLIIASMLIERGISWLHTRPFSFKASWGVLCVIFGLGMFLKYFIF